MLDGGLLIFQGETMTTTTNTLRTIACALTLGLLALISAPTAEAAAPERIVEEVDETFFDEFASSMCGVPIITSFTGTVTTTLFFDDDEPGPDRVIQKLHLRSTFTNEVTGTSISGPGPWSTVHVDIGGAEDGRNLVRVTGLEGHIVIAGEGSVVQDSGQTVLAGLPGTEPTILKQVGLFNGMGGPFPVGCQYLQ